MGDWKPLSFRALLHGVEWVEIPSFRRFALLRSTASAPRPSNTRSERPLTLPAGTQPQVREYSDISKITLEQNYHLRAHVICQLPILQLMELRSELRQDVGIILSNEINKLFSDLATQTPGPGSI